MEYIAKKYLFGIYLVVLSSADIITLLICIYYCNLAQSKYYPYAIITILVYIIEQMIIGIYIYRKKTKRSLYLMLEVLQLGFLQFLIDSNEEDQFRVEYPLKVRVIVRTILFYLQMIFYFCTEIFDEVSTTLSILMFSVYLLWSISFGFIIIGSYSLPISKGHSFMSSVVTYQFTLSSLLVIHDNNGENCGLYAEVTIALNLVVLFLFNFKIKRKVRLLEILSILTFSVPIQVKNYKITKKPMILMNFASFNENIMTGNQPLLHSLIKTTTIIVNIMYFLLSSNQLIYYLFRVRIFLISDLKDFFGVGTSLSKLNSSSNQYFVYIVYHPDLQYQLSNLNSISSKKCSSQLCQDYYDFLGIRSFCQQSQVQLADQIPLHLCRYHYQKYLINDINYNMHLFDYSKGKLDQFFFIETIVQKLQKGVLGCSHNELAYLGKIDQSNKKIILSIYNYYYQVYLYYKVVAPLMINSPKLVLYDLYEL